jgi:hypothetical protein
MIAIYLIACFSILSKVASKMRSSPSPVLSPQLNLESHSLTTQSLLADRNLPFLSTLAKHVIPVLWPQQEELLGKYGRVGE